MWTYGTTARAERLRLVDRPNSSDTRQAFKNYPVFQSAPFESAPSATTVGNDSTDAVVSELGSDGIGYAIVDQAVDLGSDHP